MQMLTVGQITHVLTSITYTDETCDSTQISGGIYVMDT